MIVSASSRTDIPAFYSEWFFNRLKAGYFDVRNPFYPQSVSRILTKDVDAYMFCTKNPLPMIDRITEIDKPVLMDVTLTPYHEDFEPNVIDKKKVIEGILRLSQILGKENIEVRYDPIILTDRYSVNYHLRAFERTCQLLEGAISAISISFLDEYKNVKIHQKELGYHLPDASELKAIGEGFSAIAKKYGIHLFTCHEKGILEPYGIPEEACFSVQRALNMTGKVFKKWKARDCGCVEMADVGVYNTCLHHCKYCYANFDESQIAQNMAQHDPHSSLLIGHLTDQDQITIRKDTGKEADRFIQENLSEQPREPETASAPEPVHGSAPNPNTVYHADGIYPGLFHHYFRGRDDLYYRISSSGAYYRPCANRFDDRCRKNAPDYNWRKSKSVCKDCPLLCYPPLTEQTMAEHLRIPSNQEPGAPIMILPLLQSGLVNFLCFDLTKTELLPSVQYQCADQIERTLQKAGFDVIKEKAPAGSGARLFVFFEESLSAKKVAEFGKAVLLDTLVHQGAWQTELFDSLNPSGPPRFPDDPGVPLRLPLDGAARKLNAGVFVHSDWKVCTNPWQTLAETRKITLVDLDRYIRSCRRKGLFGYVGTSRTQPAETKEENAQLSLFEPFKPAREVLVSSMKEPMKITLDAMIHIDLKNMPTALIGQLFLMGSYWNPDYLKKNTRYASGPRLITLARFEKKDDTKELLLPRGLFSTLKARLEKAGIEMEICDRSQKGEPLRMNFQAKLRPEQKVQVDRLLDVQQGILQAVTAAGKTVMGASIIASLQVPALVLIHSAEVLQGWLDTLNEMIQFEDPSFENYRSRSRKYPGKIGVLQGNVNSLTGRVDIAMVPTLAQKADLEELVKGYGVVLADECHHAAASTWQKVLSAIPARRIYGFSATPKREDGREQSVFWQIGPVVSSFGSKEQMERQTFIRQVQPRITPFLAQSQDGSDFTRICQEAALSPLRNQMILSDVEDALDEGRSPIVLTRFVEHARHLASRLGNPGRTVLVYAGDAKEKADNTQTLKTLSDNDEVVLVGTFASVGEGFNFPRLDTLMLALPARSSIVVSQAIGRIHRQVEGKREVLVYDYVDRFVKMLENMYQAREAEYRKQGYEILPEEQKNIALAGGEIFDESKSRKRYLEDLNQASHRFVIAARSFEPAQVLDLVSIYRQLDPGVSMDIYAETMEYPQKQLLEQTGIRFHEQERLIGRFTIIDEKIIWMSGVFASLESVGGMWRAQDPRLARELMEHRAYTESRGTQAAF